MKNDQPIFRYLAVFVFLLTVSGVVSGQKSDDEILRYLKEVEWPKAYREQDTKLLDRILADEFQMIDNEGNWSNKKLELEYVKNNKPSYETFRFEIKRLEIFENGTAVIAGTGHLTGRDKDGQYRVTYQSSNILIKMRDGWKAVSSHVSGVKRTSISSLNKTENEANDSGKADKKTIF
jgi:ketosteroid isomerase-like protein